MKKISILIIFSITLFIASNIFFNSNKFAVNNVFIKVIKSSSASSFQSIAKSKEYKQQVISSASISLASFVKTHTVIQNPPSTEQALRRQYFEWGNKYADKLPSLIRSGRTKDFIDKRALRDLKVRANAGDISAQKEYTNQLANLKKYADAGNVGAQINYAEIVHLLTTNLDEKLLKIEESKKYYIKAAVAGQAHAAGILSGNSIAIFKDDPVEALAWGFIAAKLGTTSYALHVCTESNVACTEDTFLKAYDRARFYIDFYEFKQSK